MGRMNLADARTRKSTVDREKLDATTDQDIRRYQAEDGHVELEPPATVREVRSPREIRVGLGMTQREIAAALRIPIGTWRNWEQGRVSLDPAARSLLEIVSKQPQMVLKALGESQPDLMAKVEFGQLLQSRSNAMAERVAQFMTRSDLPGPLSELGAPAISVDQLMNSFIRKREDIDELLDKLQFAVLTQRAPRDFSAPAVTPDKAPARPKRKPTAHG